MIPHISNAIKNWIRRVSQKLVMDELMQKEYQPDICLIEVGGTVGDIESMI